jgi:hypothetical protein
MSSKTVELVVSPPDPSTANPFLKTAPLPAVSGITTIVAFLVMIGLTLLLVACRKRTVWLPAAIVPKTVTAPTVPRSLSPLRYLWSGWLETTSSKRKSHVPVPIPVVDWELNEANTAAEPAAGREKVTSRPESVKAVIVVAEAVIEDFDAPRQSARESPLNT